MGQVALSGRRLSTLRLSTSCALDVRSSCSEYCSCVTGVTDSQTRGVRKTEAAAGGEGAAGADVVGEGVGGAPGEGAVVAAVLVLGRAARAEHQRACGASGQCVPPPPSVRAGVDEVGGHGPSDLLCWLTVREKVMPLARGVAAALEASAASAQARRTIIGTGVPPATGGGVVAMAEILRARDPIRRVHTCACQQGSAI